MGKGRKEQLHEYQFDEASSGSDDDSDSSDEEDYHELDSMKNSSLADGANPRQRQKISSGGGGRNGSRSYSSDDDGDDDDDDDSYSNGSDTDSSTNDSDNEEEFSTNQRLGGNAESPDSDDDNADQHAQEDGDSSSDEEDAPLHQRVLKKEGRGSLQRSSRRDRKSRALEEATKRLASFKETQRKKKEQKGKGAKGDDDEEESRKISNKSNSIAAKTKKKKNKHKPTEVSSKRADFFARGARRLNESGLGVDIGAHRYKPMDPRASNLSGHFDEDRFHKNYAFLEEMRNKEIGQVRKRIAAHKATGNKGNRLRKKLDIIQADGSHSSTLEEDVARLKELTETRANLERRKIDRAARQSVKRKIREDVESGKTGAYFLKRKEKKRLELEARFEEIRKRGGEKAVEKILAKKRQKNKSRDASAFAK